MLSLPRPPVRDDRGRRFRVRAKCPVWPDRRMREAVARVPGVDRSAGPAAGAAAVLFIAGFWLPWFVWPILAVVLLAAGWWWWSRTVSRALPLMGRCGACAYRLADLPAREDGCTVCPECGAAWRLAEEGTRGQRDEGTE